MSASLRPEPIVRLDRATKVFRTGGPPTTAVNGVSFEAFPGEVLLLLGPSGSGKSTLLSLAAGLSRPTSGFVHLWGKRLDAFTPRELQRLRAEKVGLVFQTFWLVDALTVRENVEVVLRFRGCRRAERKARTRLLLEGMKVGHLADRFPPRLSQGEKQRVAVARAVANGAELLIADEPTGSLETSQGLDIIRLLHAQAKDRGSAVLVASHDLRLTEYADRTLHLVDGSVVRDENRAGSLLAGSLI
ncbi:MAG: ABC transporter ATP-binding protein [Candidatus Aminicenantes bacterium]|nr:ABC transporter ATP-binding protein [Candidatus Aminicenantes bacterium]